MNLDQLETRQAPVKKMFTGFAPIQIVAVNPTAAKINDLLGITDAKEPVYEKDGTMRLDFWYVNHPDFKHEFRGKFALFVSNETRTSQSGKNQYIDNYTKTAWATNLAGLSEMMSSWDESRKLDMKSVREAKKGEEGVYGLMKAYANANPKSQPFVLDSWSAIASGRTNELEQFFKHFNEKGQGAKVLLGIRDGQYQDVYTGIFLNVSAGKISDYVKKNVEGEYGFKSYYAGYDFKPYDPEAAPESNEIDMFGGTAPAIDFGTPSETPNPFADTNDADPFF